MKIAVIGANGNLGSRITRQALERGLKVKCIVVENELKYNEAEMLKKSLFDLTQEDLADVDIVFSAFGSGFNAPPTLNKDAFEKYIQLMRATNKKMIVIAGAGSLYTTQEKDIFEFEQPNYPDILTEISKNIKLGIDQLCNDTDICWTVVCPSKEFDPNGALTKSYNISADRVVQWNQSGKSYVTYEDLACAMLDMAQEKTHENEIVSVLTKG